MLVLLVPFKLMLDFHPSFKHGNHSGDPESGKIVAQAHISPCSAFLQSACLSSVENPHEGFCTSWVLWCSLWSAQYKLQRFSGPSSVKNDFKDRPIFRNLLATCHKQIKWPKSYLWPTSSLLPPSPTAHWDDLSLCPVYCFTYPHGPSHCRQLLSDLLGAWSEVICTNALWRLGQADVYGMSTFLQEF